jgi:hydrogenase maturation protease
MFARERNRKVVLGLGNILNRDEGVGVHCLEPLRLRLPESVGFEVLDGGVLGISLLPLVETSTHLLVLDAVDALKPAGTVIEIEGDEIPRYSQIKMSWHQITFQEVMQLAKARGKLPGSLYLIGIQPADISAGCDLSPAVRDAVPAAVERALAILERWRMD